MPSEATGSVESSLGSLYKRILGNATWLGSVNLAVKPLWFLFITAACARLLGPDQYGLLNATLALAMLSALVADLGAVRYSVREVARDHSQASLHFTNLLVLRSALCLLGIALAIFVGWLLGYRSEALIGVGFAAVYAMSYQITHYGRAFFQAFEQLRKEAVTVVIEKVLVIGVAAAFLFGTRSAHWTLAGMALGMLLTTLVTVGWVHLRYAKVRLRRLSLRFIRSAVPLMIPFGLAGLFFHMYFRIDLVIVEAMLGETAAGQYGLAFRILDALNMLPAIVAFAAVFPHLSRLYHSAEFSHFSSLLATSIKGLVGAGAAIALVLTIFAPEVVYLLAPDPAFQEAVVPLRILMWTFPLLCLNSLLYLALASMNDERALVWMLCAVAVGNVVGNLIVIPRFGIDGAAIVTLLSEITLAILYLQRYVVRARTR